MAQQVGSGQVQKLAPTSKPQQMSLLGIGFFSLPQAEYPTGSGGC